MKYRRPPSASYFGPRLRKSSGLKVANGSSLWRLQKSDSRFGSQGMTKIQEEVKRSQENMQCVMGSRRNENNVGATNKACVDSNNIYFPSRIASEKIFKRKNMMKDQRDNFVLQQPRQNLSKVSNVGHSNSIAMKENLPPIAVASKLNISLAMSKHKNQAHTSRFDNHSVSSSKDIQHSKNSKFGNGSSKRLDKPTPLSLIDKSNASLRPLELSHKSKMNRGSVHNLNSIKISSSQPKYLKAMPGLVQNSKRRLNHDDDKREEPLPEEKPETHDGNGSEGVVQIENLTSSVMKKRRKYVARNEDEDDDTTRLSSQDAILKDCHAKVSRPLVSDCGKHQSCFCSKPIDQPLWSGILKIESEEYISLAGHLSTKSGEKVWNLSRLLRRVVEVTKVCRSEIWPERWETSRPTSDNIGLYLLPYKMRPDQYLDQLVKEVMENDLALRAVIDEAEILIFPSSLLPEQYQTFQTKHYLWGVFKPREDKAATKMALERKGPEEVRRGDAFVYSKREATFVPANNTAFTVRAEATAIGTPAAPANHGQTSSSVGVPAAGRMVSFVVRQTTRVEQLIQEMEREGALVVAMRGEMIGAGSWPDNITTPMQ